ncbi:MAG: UDP-3-O-acyl-N-acetylglucosamine deacetylase [Planctomycetota bacterium]|nr:UDP-3-O-acyl-N-acetylglucosamine deacetylase [Planctomycetota bacterium]
MSKTSPQPQTTIARPACLSGIGFFTGTDVTVQLLPADENTGIVFQRIDVPDKPLIPATIEYLLPSHRRTVIGAHGVSVEMIEHAMAALAGLGVDNCRLQLDAPEFPGFDGSSKPIVDALLSAGIVTQSASCKTFRVTDSVVASDASGATITVGHSDQPGCVVSFELDYGPESPFAAQSLTIEVTPETFANQLAFARTFVLEAEVAALKSRGYGQRVTPQDLIVFRSDGSVIDNELRATDECVRHKILDCIGDLALLGHRIHGHIVAIRSGHELNHKIVRCILGTKAPMTKATMTKAA